jgi:hypothetical protein
VGSTLGNRVDLAKTFELHAAVRTKVITEVGENSRKGNLRTLRLGLLYSAESERPKTSRGDSFDGVPNVVSGQINMLPAQRRQMF